jgi:hypothetical protein
MSPNSTTEYLFYLDYDAGTGPTAATDLKQECGDDGGMVVVPYFQLPPYGEYFDDTEGRFPMLKQMEEFLRGEYCGDTTILWFAQVLPENEEEGGGMEYLAVDIGRYGMRLVRLEATYVARCVGTRIDTEDDSAGVSDLQSWVRVGLASVLVHESTPWSGCICTEACLQLFPKVVDMDFEPFAVLRHH